jgi:chorismate synthase
MTIEKDRAHILSGVRFGLTIGSPVAIVIKNKDWRNWRRAMSRESAPAKDEARAIFVPRPGHADLAGGLKYDFADMRNVLERASARETAARVAAGAVARRLLDEFGIRIVGHVLSIGPVRARPPDFAPSRQVGTADWRASLPKGEWEQIARLAEESEVGCPDPEASARMAKVIEKARENGDTVGGVFQVVALGVPPGLGSYAHWDRRLDGRLAQAFMSIPAVKGVEIGLGFKAARLPGSKAHDEILPGPERNAVVRPTNRAGGLEGGVTNGEPVVVSAAMKPLSTLMRPMISTDMRTGAVAKAHAERSDVCAVPAAAVVGEAAAAIVLADAMMEKFGADTLEEMRRNFESYLEQVRGRFAWTGQST